MRILALAVLAIAAIWTVAPAAAQTYGFDYPVCLRVYGIVTYNECSYTSLAQCTGSASGRPAQCLVNPFFAYAQAPGRAHRRHRGVD